MRGGWVERGTVMIRLTRPHFAFFRGYLEGLDPACLAQRYLESAADVDLNKSDPRTARCAVGWIRAQLLVAARRASNRSAARLIGIAPEYLQRSQPPGVPTLDNYRQERDPDEVFSEEELIACFQVDHGAAIAHADRTGHRNARLRARQMQALRQLEMLVVADPRPADRVDGWLDPALAQRLREAGIGTLAELVATINTLGFRWYRKVPRVGEKAASQIVRWLIDPEVTSLLGMRLHVRGMTPQRQLAEQVPAQYPPRTDIVPLENLLIPATLDGAAGSNRGVRSLLSAHDDLAAIQAWLGRCKPGGHTLRSYRKEAERFLLWSIVEKGKAVSSLTVEDCIDYRDFLWNIGRVTPQVWARKFKVEQVRWLGTRGTPRWSVFWRPFEGPLTSSSQKTALVIVQSLCQWLTEQHYLHGNPFRSVGQLARGADRIDISRALTSVEWKAIKSHLASIPHDARSQRLRFMLLLAYSTGARLSELAAMRRRHLQPFQRDDSAEPQWEIRITGKGGVMRAVQLHPLVMQEIRNDFFRRGHACLDEVPPAAPLLATLASPAPHTGNHEADQPLSCARLYDVLKGFFAEVAASLPPAQHEMAARLRRASTHWLRHTFATHFLQTGGELAILRDLLGHRSLSTTSVYVTTERDHRSRAMERFGRNMSL